MATEIKKRKKERKAVRVKKGKKRGSERKEKETMEDGKEK